MNIFTHAAVLKALWARKLDVNQESLVWECMHDNLNANDSDINVCATYERIPSKITEVRGRKRSADISWRADEKARCMNRQMDGLTHNER